MKNLVEAKWLYEHLEDENLVIVDCRAQLLDSNYGINEYKNGHIENAFFINLKKDLTGEVKEHGGRSPLPELSSLKIKLENISINNQSIIVAYDEGELAGAARFWWTLKYLGHDKVYVLNGGIKAWTKNGYSLTTEVPKAGKGDFKININNNIITDIFYIKENKNNNDFILLDSRAPERYRGEIEPIDKKAGHIPGAKNFFWREILNEDCTLKNEEELRKRFMEASKYKDIVLQCGSGIDACGNFLAMDEINLKPKLYVGSFSDWVSYDENEVVTGEE